jgi:hypothetical protein
VKFENYSRKNKIGGGGITVLESMKFLGFVTMTTTYLITSFVKRYSGFNWVCSITRHTYRSSIIHVTSFLPDSYFFKFQERSNLELHLQVGYLFVLFYGKNRLLIIQPVIRLSLYQGARNSKRPKVRYRLQIK